MPLLHQLDSYIAKRNDPLENALERLNSLNIKSLIVVDDSLKVLGTITDGDIRRCYLYNNEGKFPTCYDACNKSPIVLNSEKDGDTDPRVDSSLLFPIVNAAGVLKSAYWSHPKSLNFGQGNDDDRETAFTAVKSRLAFMGMKIPTLYKQYTDLCLPGGTRFCGFNIDENFGQCIDGLVVVDLDQVKPKKRARYIEQHEMA